MGVVVASGLNAELCRRPWDLFARTEDYCVTIPGQGDLISNENNAKHLNCMLRKLSILCLILALSGLVRAQSAKSDPTGTWQTTEGTNSINKRILKLKLEGGQLTGTLSRQAGSKVEQLPLQDAKLNGTDISFATHNYAVSYVDNVLQPTDTNKWSHSKYQGTISGDTIKGKIERQSYLGNNHTLGWEAKRVTGTTQ